MVEEEKSEGLYGVKKGYVEGGKRRVREGGWDKRVYYICVCGWWRKESNQDLEKGVR